MHWKASNPMMCVCITFTWLNTPAFISFKIHAVTHYMYIT